MTGVTGAPAAIIDQVYATTSIVARDDAGLIHVWTESASGSGSFAPAPNWLGNGIPTVVDPAVGHISSASGQYWVVVYRTINGSVQVVDVRPSTGFREQTVSAPR
jgi:hypothetical protein